jgi:hypothetical protein
VSRSAYYYEYYHRPWSYSVVYPWGWYNDSWYLHYGYYYQPYRYCRGPSWWVTDYYFATTLSAYYYDYINERDYEDSLDRMAAARDRAAAEAALAEAERMQADIDEEIKEQVRRQVEEALADLERNRDRDVDQIVRDPEHIFAVSDEIDVMDLNTSEECTLSAGDLIRLKRNSLGRPMIPGAADGFAQMEVITSKAESCDIGATVAISISDLQDMENDFTETVEDGFEKMQNQRSTGSTNIP